MNDVNGLTRHGCHRVRFTAGITIREPAVNQKAPVKQRERESWPDFGRRGATWRQLGAHTRRRERARLPTPSSQISPCTTLFVTMRARTHDGSRYSGMIWRVSVAFGIANAKERVHQGKDNELLVKPGGKRRKGGRKTDVAIWFLHRAGG